MVYREEARRMWEQREDEWRKERAAREKLMHEVCVIKPNLLFNLVNSFVPCLSYEELLVK